MKKYLILALLLAFLIPSAAEAQRGRGKFHTQHLLASGAAITDTTLIATTSATFDGYPTMTVYYKFIDTGTVATTMYFESLIEEQLTNSEFVIVDSLVVSAVNTATFGIWNITDSAIGIAERCRLRKSVNTDTLIAIYKGFNGDK